MNAILITIGSALAAADRVLAFCVLNKIKARMRCTGLTQALASAAALALLAQAPAPDISLTQAWARATFPAARTAAVYLTITDHSAPDKLLSVASPVADMADLHETTMQGNVMRMRPVDGLEVSTDKPVTLAPGGLHLMLTGLKRPLKQGESFPVTLTFAKAGAIQTMVAVGAPGAAMPPMPADQGMKMPMTKP